MIKSCRRAFLTTSMLVKKVLNNHRRKQIKLRKTFNQSPSRQVRRQTEIKKKIVKAMRQTEPSQLMYLTPLRCDRLYKRPKRHRLTRLSRCSMQLMIAAPLMRSKLMLLLTAALLMKPNPASRCNFSNRSKHNLRRHSNGSPRCRTRSKVYRSSQPNLREINMMLSDSLSQRPKSPMRGTQSWSLCVLKSSSLKVSYFCKLNHKSASNRCLMT